MSGEQNALTSFLNSILKNPKQDFSLAGETFDDCHYRYQYSIKTQKITLHYFLYAFNDGRTLTEYDFFAQNFSSYKNVTNPDSIYSISFEVDAKMLSVTLVNKIDKDFRTLKNSYYSFLVLKLVQAVAASKPDQLMVNLNKDDFVCICKQGSRVACFYALQSLTDIDRQLLKAVLLGLEERMRLKEEEVSVQVLEPGTTMKKMQIMFPEAANELDHSSCLAIMLS